MGPFGHAHREGPFATPTSLRDLMSAPNGTTLRGSCLERVWRRGFHAAAVAAHGPPQNAAATAATTAAAAAAAAAGPVTGVMAVAAAAAQPTIVYSPELGRFVVVAAAASAAMAAAGSPPLDAMTPMTARRGRPSAGFPLTGLSAPGTSERQRSRSVSLVPELPDFEFTGGGGGGGYDSGDDGGDDGDGDGGGDSGDDWGPDRRSEAPQSPNDERFCETYWQ
jgi:hypothetical protein